MSKHLNLNTKFRITPRDAAFALSISQDKMQMLIKENIITARGGKVLKRDVENLLDAVYSPQFPKNIDSDKSRDIIMSAFCKPGESMKLKVTKKVM